MSEMLNRFECIWCQAVLFQNEGLTRVCLRVCVCMYVCMYVRISCTQSMELTWYQNVHMCACVHVSHVQSTEVTIQGQDVR